MCKYLDVFCNFFLYLTLHNELYFHRFLMTWMKINITKEKLGEKIDSKQVGQNGEHEQGI